MINQTAVITFIMFNLTYIHFFYCLKVYCNIILFFSLPVEKS